MIGEWSTGYTLLNRILYHIDMIYLATHDGGDLSGFDSKEYNLSNSCIYPYFLQHVAMQWIKTKYHIQTIIEHLKPSKQHACKCYDITRGKIPAPKTQGVPQATRGVKCCHLILILLHLKLLHHPHCTILIWE